MKQNLTPEQLAELNNDVAAAQAAYDAGNYEGVSQNLTKYYELQSLAGREYAAEALKVITRSGVDGKVATAMLQAVGGVKPGSKNTQT